MEVKILQILKCTIFSVNFSTKLRKQCIHLKIYARKALITFFMLETNKLKGKE